MDESELHMDAYATSLLPSEMDIVVEVEPRLPEPDAQNLEFLKFLKSFSAVPAAGSAEASVTITIDALQTEPATYALPTTTTTTTLEEVAAAAAAAPAAPAAEMREPQLEGKYIQLQLQESYPNALLEHTFLHKLHLLASSEQISFIRWTSEPGQPQMLQLDYIGLQDYLIGEHSIFHCPNVLQFTRHLLQLGFERQAEQKQYQEEAQQSREKVLRPKLYYKHENFQCNQPEKLLQLQLKLQTQSKQPEPDAELAKTKRTKSAASDPPALSKGQLHMARCRFHTLLSYNNHVRLLQLQEPSSEQQMPRRGRTSGGRHATQMLTPSLAAKQVNPSESVLHFGAGKVPEYAGFYGPVEQTLIGEFFAEYLPRYGSRTIGYKDIVVDVGKANAFQQNLPIGIVFSEDEEEPQLEPQPQAIELAGTSDETAPLETCPSTPGDMELEQVMQELCGVVSTEQTEEDLLQQQQNIVTTPELKLQLKRNSKSSRKTAEHVPTTEAKSSSKHNESLEELLRSDESKASEKQDQDQQEHKEQQDSQGATKRRRYHLRNSKSKRAL